MTEAMRPVSAGSAVGHTAAARTAGRPRPDRSHAATIPAGRVIRLLATAARAPSVHNTQPWRFKVTQRSIELHADPSRRLRQDRAGREMVMSCGAALFGLRLAVRELGYVPLSVLQPDPSRSDLLARVTLGAPATITDSERELLAAMPRRHTHRGRFEPGPLPDGLLARIQHEARLEGAQIAFIGRREDYLKLATLAADAARKQALDPTVRAETRRWTREAHSPDRDGISGSAFAAVNAAQPGRLTQRDFDLGRHIGVLLASDGDEAADGSRAADGASPGDVGDLGVPPVATAVLLTPGDTHADWMRAGQALHRVLAFAAARWVFASLYSQPLEIPPVRELIRTRLGLPGAPQILLQLGIARSTRATIRREVSDLLMEP